MGAIFETRARTAAESQSRIPTADRGAIIAALSQAGSVEAARSIALVAMAALWRRRLVALGAQEHSVAPVTCEAGVAPLSARMTDAALAFGASLAELPPEEAVYEIGRVYTASLPSAHRSSFGIFYTPPSLARRLIDHVSHAGMDWSRGKAISPGCGGGQFLVEDAVRMAECLEAADPAIAVASIGARLRGWDIDPFACWLSQVATEYSILDLVVRGGKRLPKITECRDSLRSDVSDHEGQFDLVNENPAFGKVKDSPELRKRFARSLYGHPNLYGMFTDLSIRLAKPKTGLVALLTPTSYFGGEYFKALRSTIASETRPVAIDIVERRGDVFPDVLQEVALSVFTKRRATRRLARCSIVHVGQDGLHVEQGGRLRLPSEKQLPWIIARRSRDARLVDALHKMPTRLADWGYEVSTGPLVWNRAASAGRLHDEPGPRRYPVVWAEAVSADGSFALRADRRAHLAFYEERLDPHGRTDPNLVDIPCYLLQRTTAKEQTRRLIGAPMPASLLAKYGAVAVENHLNMVRAKATKPPVSLRLITAFFSSAAADRVMRCINGSVAISASEIESMPLPSIDAIKKAFDAPDFDHALSRLYGLGRYG